MNMVLNVIEAVRYENRCNNLFFYIHFAAYK